MEEDREKDNTDIIDQTRLWVHDFVIGLNLCPFSAKPFKENTIEYTVADSHEVNDWVSLFVHECNQLLSTSTAEFSTVLIIIPHGLNDFMFFLDIVETFNDMLIDSELNVHIQLAHFHPHYQFDNTEKDDVTNYTNRSPYPMIQLLRTEEVANAIKFHGNTEDIPKRNMEVMRSMNLKELNEYLK